MIRALLLAALLAAPAGAQEFRALARLAEAPGGFEVGRRGALTLTLAMDRAVPWRVFVRDDPRRLVIDLSEVDWAGADAEALAGDTPVEVLLGRVRPGWSRMVATLPEPLAIERAWMEAPEGGPATIRVALSRTTAEAFEASTGPLVARDWDALTAPPVVATARPPQDGERPLVIALDPGHGGVDPGAERGGVTEADLMLRFAREVSDVLRRRGHEVVLTREGDVFVPLRGRGSVARAAGADMLISLHADAIEGRGARGATVYTLSAEASDGLGAELAARHLRDDLLMGMDLPEGRGDEIASILVDLARQETAPRADALADAVADRLAAAGLRMHANARSGAGFTVLKVPDIPAILLELGYMSDPRDLRNLLDHDWRRRAAEAIGAAVDLWAVEDAAR